MPKAGNPETISAVQPSLVVNNDVDMAWTPDRFQPLIRCGLVTVGNGDAVDILAFLSDVAERYECFLGDYRS
jgi:hypothetical protein